MKLQSRDAEDHIWDPARQAKQKLFERELQHV